MGGLFKSTASHLEKVDLSVALGTKPFVIALCQYCSDKEEKNEKKKEGGGTNHCLCDDGNTKEAKMQCFAGSNSLMKAALPASKQQRKSRGKQPVWKYLLVGSRVATENTYNKHFVWG